MSETREPTPAERVIAAWLDLPSVYMSGPSERSLRKARDVVGRLAAAGLGVLDTEHADAQWGVRTVGFPEVWPCADEDDARSIAADGLGRRADGLGRRTVVRRAVSDWEDVP